jgi:hypothetical protein
MKTPGCPYPFNRGNGGAFGDLGHLGHAGADQFIIENHVAAAALGLAAAYFSAG